MFLSICIPAYNAEKTIVRALEAIPKNNDDIDVFVVDDGSSDQTLSVLEKWKQSNDLNLTIVPSKHEGVSLTRQKLVNLADGEYLLFADADDYVHTDTVLLAIEQLKKTKPDILVAPYEIISEGKTNVQDVQDNLAEYFKRLALQSSENNLQNKIIKTQIVEKAFFNSELNVGEDKLILLSIYKYIKKYERISPPLFSYCINSASLTHGKKRIKPFKNFMNLYDSILPFLKDLNYAEETEMVYQYYYSLAIYCLRVLRTDLFNKNNFHDVKILKKSESYRFYKKYKSKVSNRLTMKQKIALTLFGF